MNFISRICLDASRDESELSLPIATYNFLYDFIESGSCSSICNCVEPKQLEHNHLSDTCYGCACFSYQSLSHKVYQEGDSYPNKGCNWGQFWVDWTNRITTKCTTKDLK